MENNKLYEHVDKQDFRDTGRGRGAKGPRWVCGLLTGQGRTWASIFWITKRTQHCNIAGGKCIWACEIWLGRTTQVSIYEFLKTQNCQTDGGKRTWLGDFHWPELGANVAVLPFLNSKINKHAKSRGQLTWVCDVSLAGTGGKRTLVFEFPKSLWTVTARK